MYHLVDSVVRSLHHRVVGVVTSPGPPRRRSNAYLDVAAAVSPNVDVLISNHPSRWAAMLAPLTPDLIICGSMPWKVPAEVVALPRLGAINLHPALLPRHRGPSAIEWTFRNGDPVAGFTVHRVSPEFDTGAVLAQVSVPVEDDDDQASLIGRLAPLLPGLLVRALERVALGDEGEPQDESQATYAGLLEPEWRTIDWSMTAREIHNQVRSWTGFRDSPQGALGEIGGEGIRVIRTRLIGAGPRGSAMPGTVVRRDGETFVVQCGDGPLEIVSWDRQIDV